MNRSKNSLAANRGFTLIELLAAMAILATLVLFIGRLFADASTIWRLGNKRIESATDGRAAVDFMVRELSSAVADDVLSLQHRYNIDPTIGEYRADRIYFVTLDNKPDVDNLHRQAKQVSYRVAKMKDALDQDIPHRWRILRQEVSKSSLPSFRCYIDPYWWRYPSPANAVMDQGGVVIAENVRTLEFWVYNAAGETFPDYDSMTDGPAVMVEVYLEMLAEEDSIKAAAIAAATRWDSPATKSFVTEKSKRYVGRAYLNNQFGYALAK
jgi:prepilin-type N-terminal cleavage/methylation domain-containing protein